LTSNIQMIVFFNQIIDGSGLLSGGERITLELLRRLKKSSRITVVLPQNCLAFIKDREKLDVVFSPLSFTLFPDDARCWKHIALIPLVWAVRACESIIRISLGALKDDVVFSSGDFFCNTIPAWFFKLKYPDSKAIFYIFHIIDCPGKRKGGHSFLANLFSFLAQKLSFLLIKSCRGEIFVLNDGVKQELLKKGFSGNTIHVNGAGINFKEIAETSCRGLNDFGLCFMARLSPTKGIFDLVEILRELNNPAPAKKSNLLIIGEGLAKDVEKMKELFLRYSLQTQVEFAGLKTGAAKYALMKSSRVFVFPSSEEGYAISILEALACGLAVVAWDLPVYRHVYGDRIVRVPMGRTDIFADRVRELLSNDKAREDLSRAGIAFARENDWDVIASQMATGIDSIK